MKGYSQETVKIILELDEKEARWLKSIMQNPLGLTKSEEREEDNKIRSLFWDTLDEVFEGS